MSELLQSGQHPDADQLSAFVEQALPAHEQERMLAHLAVCPDCRNIVVISMPPMEKLPAVQPKPMPARRPWFSGWNLVWPVAAAFAALILIAVLMRKGGGNAPPTQIAETRLPDKPAAAVGAAPARTGVSAGRAANPSPKNQDRTIDVAQTEKQALGKAPAGPKVDGPSVANLPLNGRNLQRVPLQAEPGIMAGMAGGIVSGSSLAQQKQASGNSGSGRHQPSASAGPLAAAPPKADAMGTAANKNMVDASAASVATEPASNASTAALPTMSLAGLASNGNVLLHPLPSGLPALSVATAGQTRLALDSGNALFLSGDGGTHWKQVRAKWQGRAMKVALVVSPVALTDQPFALNRSDVRNDLHGRMSDATGAAAAARPFAAVDATLTGQITDSTGAAIPGAAVTVTDAATAAAVTVKTDAVGRYFAGGLAVGAYRIDATARGFARQEKNVTLEPSQQEKIDIKLQPGQMSETVTVTSAALPIETQSTSLSTEIRKSKLRRSAPTVFAITTDSGERWVSADGQSWKRE